MATKRLGGTLRVGVLNGNLKFIRQPLMLGHYRSLELTGTEAVVDDLIGGMLARSMSTGLYATGLETHQVFVNPHSATEDPYSLPKPPAVIVVGLAEEGELTSERLSRTVRQAAIAYAQRAAEWNIDVSAGFELAATLIGSGGAGIDAGGAAQAVTTGVRDANRWLEAQGWPRVSQLCLVELYLDRATEAHQALRLLADSKPGEFAVWPQIGQGFGPLRRPTGFGYRGARYDFIGVAWRTEDSIEFTVDTKRARADLRVRKVQSGLLNELIRVGAHEDNLDTQIGRTLFDLIVPVEVSPFLAGSTAVVLQVDNETAKIPWEMLDTSPHASGPETKPWAVRTCMIRQLVTDRFREGPAMAGAPKALVIGTPQCPPDIYLPLWAAEKEARDVAGVLGVTPRIGLDALGVVNSLLEEPWRIVHITGHGKLADLTSPGTGVVLTNGTVLGASEIEAMRKVPELVFVNCCHLGSMADGTSQGSPDLGHRRPEFAAGIARALIGIGVRCVVAAGWAVVDEVAATFATVFYKELLGGANFMEAVGRARTKAWEADPEGNTWAAYQCYGDPGWKYTKAEGEEQTATAAKDVPMEAIVSSVGLATELETIAIRAGETAQGDRKREMLRNVEQMAKKFEAIWGGQGAVAEAFGLAFNATGDRGRAIEWYARAVAALDASASLRAAEQHANLLARHAAKTLAPEPARLDIDLAIGKLTVLNELHETSERRSLLGSAWKQRALVESAALEQAGKDSAERRRSEQAWRSAIEMMRAQYGAAADLAEQEGADNAFYPLINMLVADLVLHGDDPRWRGFDKPAVMKARESIARKDAVDPDFWTHTNAIELESYTAIADGTFAAKWPKLKERLLAAKVRVPIGSKWESLATQARFAVGKLTGAARPADKEGRLSSSNRQAIAELTGLLDGFTR